MTEPTMRDIAYNWLADYIITHEEIDIICLCEGMSDEAWSKHLDFVTECFEKGIKPTHFVDKMIADQQAYNELYQEVDMLSRYRIEPGDWLAATGELVDDDVVVLKLKKPQTSD